jgi:hypothetical protein
VRDSACAAGSLLLLRSGNLRNINSRPAQPC